MSTVYLGDTTRVRVTFYGWSSTQSSSVIEDPTTVVYSVYATATPATILLTGTPTKEATGIYRYDWTPSALGDYSVKFLGTFADGSTDVVVQRFTVQDPGSASSTPGVSLLQDETITFAGVIDPLYLDPEELAGVFTDATQLDIAYQIFIASSEIKNLFKLGDDEVPVDIALEYVKAAAACGLSRVFEMGDGNEQAITLGDFSVAYRSFPKSSVNRGNATTWCEMAAALRKEMIYKARGSRSFVAGSSYNNPIPMRRIQSRERGWLNEKHSGLLIDPNNPYDASLQGTHQHQGLLDGQPS